MSEKKMAQAIADSKLFVKGVIDPEAVNEFVILKGTNFSARQRN